MVKYLTKIYGSFLIVLLLVHCSPKTLQTFQKDWQRYQTYFIRQGRVIDTANQNISHSEGQGYAMLFAVVAEDRQAFTQLWRWTKHHLQRSDYLFSWKYVPCPSDDHQCVVDPNNATDGDILIAWSLLAAAKQWRQPTYGTEAINIIRAIREQTIRRRFGYQIILPGVYGFDTQHHTQLNLSYWIFPALKTFGHITGDLIWDEVYQSGLSLLHQARFGIWHLPPDWVMLTKDGLSLRDTVSQEYGYNACRIPLYLLLDKQLDETILTPFMAFWAQSFVPATINLSNGRAADYHYPPGMEAIAIATRRVLQAQRSPALPEITEQTDYYSASLIMLSQIALREGQR
jgi:endoglucanase